MSGCPADRRRENPAPCIESVDRVEVTHNGTTLEIDYTVRVPNAEEAAHPEIARLPIHPYEGTG